MPLLHPGRSDAASAGGDSWFGLARPRTVLQHPHRHTQPGANYHRNVWIGIPWLVASRLPVSYGQRIFVGRCHCTGQFGSHAIWFASDAILTVVDCVNFPGYAELPLYCEAASGTTRYYRHQAEHGTALRALDDVVERINELNDETPKIRVGIDGDGLKPELAFGHGITRVLFATIPARVHDVKDHADRDVQTTRIDVPRDDACQRMPSGEEVQRVLDYVSAETVFRIKGFVRVLEAEREAVLLVNWAFRRCSMQPQLTGPASLPTNAAATRGDDGKRCAVRSTAVARATCQSVWKIVSIRQWLATLFDARWLEQLHPTIPPVCSSGASQGGGLTDFVNTPGAQAVNGLGWGFSAIMDRRPATIPG